MDRIKRIEDVVVRGDMLLCEVIEVKQKSGLYLPDSVKDTKEGIDHMIVIGMGESITDVKAGDIVLMLQGSVTTFPYKDKIYGYVQRYNCSIIVDKDNFEG